MLHVGVLCVAAFITIFLTRWGYGWRNPKCKNGILPPGSMGFPLIGETLELLIPGRSLDIHPFIKKRVERYGPIFRTCLVGKPVVVSADPEVNHYLLLQEGKSVELWYMDAFTKLFDKDGGGKMDAFTAPHRYTRSTVMNHFGVESLREKLLPEIEKQVNKTLRAWSEKDLVNVKSASAKAEHEAILSKKMPGEALTWGEYKSMTYTLQLRRTTKDVRVNGYTIPQGWTVMVATSAQQLNPNTYKDPLAFNPDRWKELDSTVISKNFMPFGAGTRQCAGAEYTRVFMSIFFNVLCTQYRWIKVKGGEKISRKPFLDFGDGICIKLSQNI